MEELAREERGKGFGEGRGGFEFDGWIGRGMVKEAPL